MTAKKAPSISIVIPAYNAETELVECLQAIEVSACSPLEVIVVNDGSTDGTADVASACNVRLVNSGRRQSGPAAARNTGAEIAAGEALLFVDADVVMQPDTVGRIADHFAEAADLAAVFGSYDAKPRASNFLSQYKNLQHHFVHQTANSEAETFWAGCGAIRADIFRQLGGFNAQQYAVPAIEDIELGVRLRLRGFRILLDRNIQVCHLKRWTFLKLVRTEIFCRAIPWSTLILSQNEMPRDLNLSIRDRASAVLVWLTVCSLPLVFWAAWTMLFPFAGVALLVFLNRAFYGFLLRLRGGWFVVRTIPVHALYYLYSSLSFAFCWIRYRLSWRQRRGGCVN